MSDEDLGLLLCLIPALVAFCVVYWVTKRAPASKKEPFPSDWEPKDPKRLEALRKLLGKHVDDDSIKAVVRNIEKDKVSTTSNEGRKRE